MNKITALAFLLLMSAIAYSLLNGFLDEKKPKFQVTLKVRAEGEDITIKRVFECEERRASQGLGSKVVTYWEASNRAFGVELPSGAGVFMPTPRLCANLRGQANGELEFFPLSNEYFPLLGWTSNADSKDIIEVYLTKESITKPSARIQLISISAEPAEVDAPVSRPDKFLGFHPGGGERGQQNYRGFALIPVDYEQVKTSHEFVLGKRMGNVPVLLSENDSGVLDAYFEERRLKNNLIWGYRQIERPHYQSGHSTILETAFNGFGVAPYPSVDGRYSHKSTPNQDFSKVLPLILEGDRLVANFAHSGILQLHRMTSPLLTEESYTTFPINFRETTLRPEKTVAYISDPESQKFFLVQPIAITLAGAFF